MSHIINGDALEELSKLEDGSVDFILTEPPYFPNLDGFTKDITFQSIWKEFNRIIKKNRNIAIISNQPYTTRLIHSNLSQYRYNWYWIHNRQLNVDAPAPINILEEVCIFGGSKLNKIHQKMDNIIHIDYGKTEYGMYQKPIELCEHLIKVYSNPNEVILDCFAGSGSTGIAATNLNREYILIEKDKKAFDEMCIRLNKTDNN